ncbi:hypothetical protein OP500_03260 [Kingella sp. SNUBH-2017]|uniref:DUF7832 domain-containing protein n=1 Tax=Kingella pumchi TaxID=2779506 RepID=A0ABS9NMR6_9NEIS|nr:MULTISPECIES: hypothetical protein [Kingella]MCG6504092.1 hypothetical protein [Kingella pumchi]MDD2182341.1 hypothetical protein [Kingella sp. SNUBH-2017]
MHYDHISFHIDENYPPELPHGNALHHMAHYYAWAVSQNLHSAAAAALPGFAQMQRGETPAAQFVERQLAQGLDDTCFNDLGRRFTAFYYADEDEGYGRFIEDYFAALGLESEADFYRTEGSPAEAAKLFPRFQAAFERWYGSLKDK